MSTIKKLVSHLLDEDMDRLLELKVNIALVSGGILAFGLIFYLQH